MHMSDREKIESRQEGRIMNVYDREQSELR